MLIVTTLIVNITSILLSFLVIVSSIITSAFLLSYKQVIADIEKSTISTLKVFLNGNFKHKLLLDRSWKAANIYIEQYTHSITTVTQLTINGKTLLLCKNKKSAGKVLGVINIAITKTVSN